MKIFLKAFAIAAAFGLAPGAALAQGAAPANTTAAAPAAAANSVAPAANAAMPAAPPQAAPAPGIGQPDGRMGLPDQVSPIGVEAARFNDLILTPVIVAISIFVMILLAWVMFRYRRGANPTPSRNSHNTTLEVVWTLVPVVILVVIAVPSIRLLANQYSPPAADLTLKVTGNQWNWSYEYPDHGVEFTANMLPDDQARARGEPRQLATDNRVVVPVGAVVKVLVTSSDVIHAWGVPAFWVKMDAVPGRINETWFRADREGVYYGVCYELCGARHGYMPITVEVVSRERFAQWVASRGGHMPGTAAAAAPQPAVSANEATAATPAPSNVVNAAQPAATTNQAATQN
ncbi:cytochrome c oxidase subunit II [Sphingosinicella sp.]|uniref:cytochrome c oxidase subunit II n=1 Tax=Sphingosinicella sp. TaxID=1917971 RepID=UPI0040377AC3